MLYINLILNSDDILSYFTDLDVEAMGVNIIIMFWYIAGSNRQIHHTFSIQYILSTGSDI